MANNQRATPVDATNARKTFYPMLIFLLYLTSTHPQRRFAQDSAPDLALGPEEFFRGFVSKLAFMACTQRGGASVSACTVLQLPDRVQFVFAFNERSANELTLIRDGISYVLRMLRHPLPDPDSDEAATLHRNMLTRVLSLNHGRVKGYLSSFRTHVETCIAACGHESSREGQTIISVLQPTRQLIKDCFTSQTGGNTVDVALVIQLLAELDQAKGSTAFGLIRARVARHQHLWSTNCWSELIHVSGRLLSYRQAVDVAVLTSRIWPQIFDEFEVCMIPSSSKMADYLREQPMVAEEIIRKMPVKEAREKCLGQLRLLADRSMNRNIALEWQSASTPLVHAEVLLHDWLERTEGGTRPERFFNHWKFIGTSKPPCKLCAYFFEECPTDVQVRSSSRNLYFGWRMPDLPLDPDPGIFQIHRNTYNRIKDRLRGDIERILSERLADGRPHDSSAYTTVPAPQAMGFPIASAVVDSLSSFHISDIQSIVSTDVQNDHNSTQSVDEGHEEEEEDVLLFRGRRKY